MRVWDNSDKTGSVTLPVNVPSAKAFWIEGASPSSVVNDVVFNLESVGDNSQKDSVALTILQVNKVEILGKGNSINDDDNLDAELTPHSSSGKESIP